MKPICSNAVFQISDLEKSIAFYTGVLGFELDFKYGEPNFYAGLNLGPVSLHLNTNNRFKDYTGRGHIYIFCDEVDTLYDDLVKKGVKINSPIGDQAYGLRDFNISDPDGNMLGFGASLEEKSE